MLRASFLDPTQWMILQGKEISKPVSVCLKSWDVPENEQAGLYLRYIYTLFIYYL